MTIAPPSPPCLVDVEDPLDIGGLGVGQPAEGTGDPGAVHQRVDGPDLSVDPLEQPKHRVRISRIRGDDVRFASGGADLLGHRIRCGLV